MKTGTVNINTEKIKEAFSSGTRNEKIRITEAIVHRAMKDWDLLTEEQKASVKRLGERVGISVIHLTK